MENELDVEVMGNILEDLKVVANNEQIEKIVNNFISYLNTQREMSSIQYAGFVEECKNCKILESENKELIYKVKVYNDSVKQRRGASSVYIKDGEVLYDK